MLDFLHSRTFITHLTGLLGVAGSGWLLPNSPAVSIAMAIITGITQAAHAFNNLKGKPTVDVAQSMSHLIVTPGLYNAAGTAQVEPEPGPTP